MAGELCSRLHPVGAGMRQDLRGRFRRSHPATAGTAVRAEEDALYFLDGSSPALVTNQSSEARERQRKRCGRAAESVRVWSNWLIACPIPEGWPYGAYDNIASSGTPNLLPHPTESPTSGGGAIHDIVATQSPPRLCHSRPVEPVYRTVYYPGAT